MRRCREVLFAAALLVAAPAARAQGSSAPPPTTPAAAPPADTAVRGAAVCEDADHDGRCDVVPRPLACPAGAGGMSEPGRPCERHPRCVDADDDGRCDLGAAGMPARGGLFGWLGRVAVGSWVGAKAKGKHTDEGHAP